MNLRRCSAVFNAIPARFSQKEKKDAYIEIICCVCFQAVMLTVLASRAFKGLLSRFFTARHTAWKQLCDG